MPKPVRAKITQTLNSGKTRAVIFRHTAFKLSGVKHLFWWTGCAASSKWGGYSVKGFCHQKFYFVEPLLAEIH